MSKTYVVVRHEPVPGVCGLVRYEPVAEETSAARAEEVRASLTLQQGRRHTVFTKEAQP